MKKYILSVIIFGMFSANMQGQIDPGLEITIKSRFFNRWIYFRMIKNPLLNDDDKYDNTGRKDPYKLLLPPEHAKYYGADIKVLPWYDQEMNPVLGYVSFNPKGFYILEKGEGHTGVIHSFYRSWSMPEAEHLKDTVHVSVYDSLFHYDNRFLVYVPEIDRGPIYFYSGNVEWDGWRYLNFGVNHLRDVAYVRGVQFGLQELRWRLPDEWIEDFNEYLPEYSGWEFACADKSFFTHGRLLITSPHEKATEYMEFLFYSDNPEKTGDKVGVYYEFKYIFPTIIKSISERRMEKRKLTTEEFEKIRSTSLRYFLDPWRARTGQIVEEIEDE